MQLVQGAVRPNVGDLLTKYGGRGAPWKAVDDGNKDAEVVKERELGMHDIRGGAKIDLYRGGPPKTEKRPFRYAFEGGVLGKHSNKALNHRDEVLVRHSVIGFPRWDAEGEPVAEEEDGAEEDKSKGGDGEKDEDEEKEGEADREGADDGGAEEDTEEQEKKEELAAFLDKALDLDGSTPRGPSVEQDDAGIFAHEPRAQQDTWDADKAHGPKGRKQPLLHLPRVRGQAQAVRRSGMRVGMGGRHGWLRLTGKTLPLTKSASSLAAGGEEVTDGGKDVWGDDYAPKAEEEEEEEERGAAGDDAAGEDESMDKDVWGDEVRPSDSAGGEDDAEEGGEKEEAGDGDDEEEQGQDEEQGQHQGAERHDRKAEAEEGAARVEQNALDQDQGAKEEQQEASGGRVKVCDTMNAVGCKIKHVDSYQDHSATAHGNAQPPAPARLVRVCSPSLGIGKKGCKLVPDFHRMAADEHQDRINAVAEKHELSFLLVKLDVHAESEEVRRCCSVTPDHGRWGLVAMPGMRAAARQTGRPEQACTLKVLRQGTGPLLRRRCRQPFGRPGAGGVPVFVAGALVLSCLPAR